MCLPCIWQPTFPCDPDANFDPFLVILSHFCQEWAWEVEARCLCSQHGLLLNSDCNGCAIWGLADSTSVWLLFVYSQTLCTVSSIYFIHIYMWCFPKSRGCPRLSLWKHCEDKGAMIGLQILRTVFSHFPAIVRNIVSQLIALCYVY